MPHAVVENRSICACEHLFLADEEGRSVLVVLAQATFSIRDAHTLTLADKAVPPSLTGLLHGADAAISSYRIEPALAFMKPTTDVVLLAHAQTGGRFVPELQVVLRVGPLGKALRVIGDRVWVKSGAHIVATRPQPFEQMPLVYERAFGGWDRSHPDPARHVFDPRNPVGVGFRAPDGRFEEGLRLPNIDDPNNPLQRYGQSVAPAGVGFVSPHWQPRVAFAGTCDEAWQKDRMPLLPRDFDRRFFNAASPGLVAPGYLTGNEPVLVDNASRWGRVMFNLPGMPAPPCRVQMWRRPDVPLALKLDTVVIDTDEERVLLLWRGHLPLRDGPHDVQGIELSEQAKVAVGYAPRGAAV